MPVYTLYLSTISSPDPNGNQGVPTDRSNLANVSWSVNFDELFRYENQKYSKCRVKYHLLMRQWTAVATDWNTYMGYLSCNLASAQGGFGQYGTLLGPLYPLDSPTTGTGNHVMFVNTSQDMGVDVNVPTGFQTFTLSFNRADLSSGARISNLNDYQIILYFELYDEK
jgi:hypothetical protein